MPHPVDTSRRQSPLVPLREAARTLSISVRTLRDLASAGRIAFVRVSARRLAIDPADLERYIDEQRVPRAKGKGD